VTPFVLLLAVLAQEPVAAALDEAAAAILLEALTAVASR